MKNRIFLAALLSFLVILPGCSLIEGIFKAGVWTGIIVVAIIIGLIIYLISRIKR